MKLRLLNASHQALCYLGYLAGYRYAHEVCQDPLFADFLLGYMDREAHARRCAPVPGRRPGRLQAPADRALRQPRGPRHPRPAVRRELRPDPEVAGAGDPAQPRDRRRDRPLGRGRRRWARYAEGVDEQGEPIEVVDRLRDTRHGSGRAPAQGDDRWPSSATATCSATSSTTSASPTPYPLALDSLHAARCPRHARGPAPAAADRVKRAGRHARRGPAPSRVRSTIERAAGARPRPGRGAGHGSAAVGVCGSDTHYYDHGRIGQLRRRVAARARPRGRRRHRRGRRRRRPRTGGRARLDRARRARASPAGSACAGRYNLCPDMRFFATPPIDGSLRRARASSTRPSPTRCPTRRRRGRRAAGAAVGRQSGPAARPGTARQPRAGHRRRARSGWSAVQIALRLRRHRGHRRRRQRRPARARGASSEPRPVDARAPAPRRALPEAAPDVLIECSGHPRGHGRAAVARTRPGRPRGARRHGRGRGAAAPVRRSRSASSS